MGIDLRWNGRMRLPPQLRVPLRQSRLAAWLVVTITLATAIIIVALPWPAATLRAGLAGLAFWAWDCLCDIAWRSRPRSVVEIALALDRTIVVRFADDTLAAGVVRASSFVSAPLTTIVWKPDRAWRASSLLILPDMLAADDFRRMRVYLRYGRREEVAGAPTSQA